MNAPSFSRKSIYIASFFILLVGVMLSGLAKVSTASAQDAARETPMVDLTVKEAFLSMTNTTPHPDTLVTPDILAATSTANSESLFADLGSPAFTGQIVPVANTTIDPWRKIAFLEVWAGLSLGRCTGWFIGPHTVITAAHCVYNPEFPGNHWATSIRVIPGKAGGIPGVPGIAEPNGYEWASSWKTSPNWVSASNSYPAGDSMVAKEDYAAVFLPDDNLGNSMGWFRYGYFSDDFLRSQSNVSLAGYPGDKPFGTQWLSNSSGFTLDSRYPDILGYELYATEGSSGSPVWYVNSSSGPVVVSIDTNGNNSSPNYGPKFTSDIVSILKSWGAATEPLTDISSNCPQSGGVILYYNANYDCNGQGANSGYVQRSSAGWQNITGGMNENASSVKMPAGWSVMLYENPDRGGGKKCLNSTDSGLSDFNYLGNFPNTAIPVADHASSFEVFTTTGCATGSVTPQPTPPPGDGIEVCDTTNYGAPCKTYTYISNSACTNLASDGWDNKIESLRFKGAYVGGYDIILYDDNSCGTYIARYGSDASSLGMLNNLTGSVRIEQHAPPATATANPGDGLDLCDGTNWGAPCKRYTFTNNSTCINLVPDGWGERADSLRFIGSYVSNYDVILYDDSSCGTYNARYGEDAYDLGAFKNAISSIQLQQHAIINPTPPAGSINLCDGTNYGQPCQAFTYVSNGYCTNLQPYGWDNRADSLKFMDGYVGNFDIILFDDNGCNVYNARYGSDASDLGAFKNSIGSIQIERHGAPKPDLIPYPRSGRSAPVVISAVGGTTTNSTLYAGEPIFIDWGYKNNGSANALAHNVKLTINGQSFIDYPFGGLNSGGTNGFDDWSLTWDTPGTFTVSLVTDPYSAVDESDEGNNTWSGQFTWVLRPPNQFNKSTPSNGAPSQPLALSLNWTDSSGVNSYQYCYDTSNNNNCDTSWSDVGSSTTVGMSGLNPGTTYYWHVRASNNSGSTYADGNTWWSFSTAPSVPNDDFNNATQPIVIPYSTSQTTTGATSAGDDSAFPCITGNGYHTVWFKYVPSANGRVTINTFDSSFDTVLGVWSGNRGSLVNQACNDDTVGLQSEVQLQVVGGTPYFIEVAGYSPSSYGTLQLSVGPAATCPTITAWKGEYWANQSFSGSPALCRNDLDLNFDWGMGSPDPLIPDDHFSARWTKTSAFGAGTYRFHLRHDDGGRIYVDDVLKLDVWGTCCVWETVDIPLQGGDHTIRVDYFEDGGAAHAQLWWERIGAAGRSGADTTGVFRPSNGLLYLKNKNDTGFADLALNYGLPGDYPVVGDWDGDGTATIGVYRKGYFYLRNANTLGFADVVFPFGQPGDQPIAGDWNGDGVDTIGVYRTATGQFLLRNSNTEGGAEMSFYLGNVGDVGVAGDWDGDGKDTTGVFRPSNGVIFLKNKNEDGFADIALNYGLPGDRPVMGDWDNDGTDTIGIYRNGTFFLRNENTNGFAEIVFGLGNPGDMPIAGDWDGLP